MKPSYPKLIVAGLTGLYFLSIAYDPMQGSLLDIVDLPIHETGHLVFRIFGEFMGIAKASASSARSRGSITDSSATVSNASSRSRIPITRGRGG